MNTISIALVLLIIAIIFIAYYYDFKLSIIKSFDLLESWDKKIGKTFIYLGVLFCLSKAYDLFIPLNKKHGMEFNSEREQLGIPTLKPNWVINEYDSEQFATYWWKPKPRNGHFKKIIEYGILDCKTETDYYHNEKLKGTFAWSKYDFGKNKFEYFIESPNKNKISITKNGLLKMEKPTVVKNISKSEFQNYIAK